MLEIDRFPGLIYYEGKRIELDNDQIDWLKKSYKTSNVCVIAEEMGLSRFTVRRLLDRYDVKRKLRPRKVEHRKPKLTDDFHKAVERNRRELKELLASPIEEPKKKKEKQGVCIGRKCYSFRICTGEYKMKTPSRVKVPKVCDAIVQ